MFEILKDIHRRLYGGGQMLILLHIPGIELSTGFRVFDYQLYDSNKTIVISSDHDDELTVDISQIKTIEVIPGFESNEYNIVSKLGWTAEIRFV